MFYDYSPGFSVPGLPGGFRFFLGGGGIGYLSVKIIMCIKSGTLLGHILRGSSQ